MVFPPDQFKGANEFVFKNNKNSYVVDVYLFPITIISSVISAPWGGQTTLLHFLDQKLQCCFQI